MTSKALRSNTRLLGRKRRTGRAKYSASVLADVRAIAAYTFCAVAATSEVNVSVGAIDCVAPLCSALGIDGRARGRTSGCGGQEKDVDSR